MRSRIKYNSSLSIKENANLNNVSEATLRYYIKTENIDRRYEAKNAIVAKIRRVLADDGSMSQRQLSKKIGISINTVKKYLPYATGEIELSN